MDIFVSKFFYSSPSVHQSFNEETERDLKMVFEGAENIGKSWISCDEKYPKCSVSPLKLNSKFIDVE